MYITTWNNALLNNDEESKSYADCFNTFLFSYCNKKQTNLTIIQKDIIGTA